MNILNNSSIIVILYTCTTKDPEYEQTMYLFSLETYAWARHRVTSVVVYTMFSDACLVVKDDPSAEISARFHFDSSELKVIGQI